MDGLRTIICLLLAGPGFTCALGAGCTMTDGGDPYAQPDPVRRYDDGDGYSNGYQAPPPVYAEAPAVEEEERQGPLVPRTARLAAEGRGDLSYKAKRDGYVYIVDRRDKKLIAQMPLDEGEELLIAPFRNVLEVDGKRVKRVKDLDNKHIHEIYFERDADSGRDRRDRDRDRRNR